MRHVYEEMSAAEREDIPEKDFVFPSRRAWPIHDLEHAKIALQYIKAGRGNPKDWPKVKAAVFKRYPELAESMDPTMRSLIEHIESQMNRGCCGG